MFKHEMLGLCWLGCLTQNEAKTVMRDYVPHYPLLMGARTNEYAADHAVSMIVARELERIRINTKRE